LLVAFLFTALLQRIIFVRENKHLRVAIFVNPGLVGLLAGATFLTRDGFPALSRALWIASMATIVVSLIGIVLLVPRAIRTRGASTASPDSVPDGEDGTRSL
jgi:hypothetical protein